MAPDPALLLDDLYRATFEYRNSTKYTELLEYLARFRDYAPYNCFLLRMQQPKVGYVATPADWSRRFGRHVKAGGRALIMLRPFGPVMFVYDVDDTEGTSIPDHLLQPFSADGQLAQAVWANTVANCAVDGIEVLRQEASRTHAGHVVLVSNRPLTFRLVVNAEQKLATAYATLVHEIAHVYCGHLGPHPHRLWPDRANLGQAEREFEAESVSFIVCARQGLASNACEYLAGHLNGQHTIPEIDINRVMLVSSRIEEMGKQIKKKKEKKEDTQATLFN
jgi:hypothetical protein